MISVASLLLIVGLSMLVVRVGTVAFLMTGLSEEVARFQALSAFSGAGFTTQETESIVADPARRYTAAWLIRLGSVGIVTSVATLMLSFVGAGQAAPQRLLVLMAGVIVLITLARSRYFNRLLTPVIENTLASYSTLELRDYADLLSLREDYRIVEIEIEPETWLIDQTLHELDLASEGVLVLGVKRPGEEYIGAPPADLRLREDDLLIVYGREHRLKELSTRQPWNQAAHRDAQLQHQDDLDEQRERVEELEAE